ncbi:hypothetical protein MKX03_030445 [Papaver bracteatum]|nr:hypothetical protein MKX03_030445 [Papaver bracteatum]
MVDNMMEPRLYSCFHCRNIVSCHEDIMAKTFVYPGVYAGVWRTSFLFSHAMNVLIGTKGKANLITGQHVVADISCSDCKKVLGWKYESAVPESEKYKEGKFVFVNKNIVKANW